MNTKTSLSKILSVIVVLALSINTAVYAMPADISTLRTPSTAIATVNAESGEIKASPIAKIALAIVLAGVLAPPNASSATVTAANYNNQIKLQVQQVVAKVSVEQLIRDLDSKDGYLVNAAVDALVKKGEPAVPDLIKALKNNNNLTRDYIVKVLSKIGEPAVPDLIKALKNNNVYIRRYAIKTIARIGSAAEIAVPDLIKALRSDEDANVRSYAAYALGEIGPAAEIAVPDLIKALRNDEDANVRIYAAYALGEIGPAAKAAVPALIKALEDNNVYVRINAIIALGEIGPAAEAAVPALIYILRDINNDISDYYVPRGFSRADVCGNVIIAFSKIGKPAVPALMKALGDNKPIVRKYAAEALKILRQNINIQQQTPKRKPDTQDGAMLPSLYPHPAKASSVNYQHTVERHRASLAALIAA